MSNVNNQGPTLERFSNDGEVVEPDPLDTTGLCLLSLDGGGVRGLSSLYILKGLMARLNHERKIANLQPVKPCEVFDLIGGTSTGGLIAVMLGRLEMDVDECITAYSELMEMIFKEKRSRLPFGLKWQIKSRFDSQKLKSAVTKVIVNRGLPEGEPMNGGKTSGCKVFVCATAKETTGTTRLRSYDLPEESNVRATICEAALATSAATSFFDPVQIGARKFVDGGVGANNPVDHVEGEATNIWCPDTGDLKHQLKCFISVGTGVPEKKAIEDSAIKFFSKTLVGLAKETQKTAEIFAARWRQQINEKRYFRFNVHQGLQGVGMAEYDYQGTIEAVTDEYLRDTEQKIRVRDCVQNLKQKQNRPSAGFAATIKEFHLSRITQLEPSIYKAHVDIPFQRNENFVGRAKKLHEIEKCLFHKDYCRKVAVKGLGGVGKTQVVLEIAYRTIERSPGCSVFWLPATDLQSLQQAYLKIADQLQIPGLENNKSNAPALVRDFLNRNDAGQWLLIIDNADDLDMWLSKGTEKESRPRRLMDCLPNRSGGSILFTTRSRKCACELANQNVIDVPKMDEEDASQFFRKILINQDLLDDETAKRDLLNWLCYLPLAIVQAAKYINKNSTTLTEYISLLQDQDHHVIELLSENFEDEGRYPDQKNPIATTWLISFEQMRKEDPLAAEYLSFMSCIDSKAIPLSLLPPAEPKKRAIDAIGTLTSYSFVIHRGEDPALDLHRLVHLAMQNWLRDSGRLKARVNETVTWLGDRLPSGNPKSRALWRTYLPHALRLISSEYFDTDSEGSLRLLQGIGACLFHDG
ncbi:MAG: hypothetical protein M4579_005014, partial [Chaenotheca gracillima]